MNVNLLGSAASRMLAAFANSKSLTISLKSKQRMAVKRSLVAAVILFHVPEIKAKSARHVSLINSSLERFNGC
jgi:hypothetical protein